MSHELTTRKNGTVEHAYAGAVGWHGLGNRLEAGATIEQWIAAAGMDWRILRAKVRYPVSAASAADPSTWMTMDDRHVLFRSDNHEPLGCVSRKYKVVQPAQVLEFFRDMAERAGMQLETAGTLFGGKRMWALAKITEAKIAGWDTIGAYLLLSTACDGSMVTEARQTTVRVVCNNTLTMARADSAAAVKVRHSSVFNAEQVKKELGISAQADFAKMVQQIEYLSQVGVSEGAARDFLRTLLRPKTVEAQPAGAGDFATLLKGTVRLADAPAATAAAQVLDRAHPGEAAILDLFTGLGKGATRQGSAGTAWGLVNAVTEYVDHHARAKTDSHRMNSAFFGAGDDLKTRAFEAALAMAA